MRDLTILLSVLAGLAGVAVGTVAGLGIGPAEPAPTDAPAVEEPPCEEQVAELTTTLARLGEEKAKLDQEIMRARRKRAAVRGMERAWPETPPDLLTEEALTEHLDRVLEGSPATLERLDCSAYPCVAVLSWDVPEIERDLVDAGDGEANLSGALMALLMDGDYGSLPVFYTGRLVGDDLDASVHAFSWLDPQDYSDAKNSDPEQAMVDGTVIDAAEGRTEEVFETWLDEQGPDFEVQR